MSNLPEVKIGVVAVSRDCFPESLSVNRRKALMKAYTEKYGTDSVYECPVCIVESEIHMVQALEDIKKAGCNACYDGHSAIHIHNVVVEKCSQSSHLSFVGHSLLLSSPIPAASWERIMAPSPAARRKGL